MTDHYKITIQTWKKVAKLYEEKFMDFEIYNESYEAFYSEISKPNASILEIGCGPGNVEKAPSPINNSSYRCRIRNDRSGKKERGKCSI